MELLLAILFALNGFVGSGKSIEEIRVENPDTYQHAQTIIDNHYYRVDESTNVIIIDETGDHH